MQVIQEITAQPVMVELQVRLVTLVHQVVRVTLAIMVQQVQVAPLV
jgi:hypothetical protein